MYLSACTNTYVSAFVCAGFKAAIQGSFARRFGVFSSSSSLPCCCSVLCGSSGAILFFCTCSVLEHLIAALRCALIIVVILFRIFFPYFSVFFFLSFFLFSVVAVCCLYKASNLVVYHIRTLLLPLPAFPHCPPLLLCKFVNLLAFVVTASSKRLRQAKKQKCWGPPPQL